MIEEQARQNLIRPTIVIPVALVLTLGAGLWMRWSLAGALPLAVDFAHLRHAHSHLGYFGVLFPLAWLGWGIGGAPVPGRRVLFLYGAATVLAVLGFLRAGYGPEAIAGCTIVGAVWVATAWPLRRRMRDWRDPLPAALPGVLLSLACIPPIALNLRKAPEVAHGFVATFLAMLLLVVIVPSALASGRPRGAPWPLLVLAGTLGAAALGVWPSWIARAGLLLYAGLLLGSMLGSSVGLHLQAAWALVSMGLAAIALGLLPNTRPVALGAIHFLVLSPVLATLAPHVLRRSPPVWAWLIGHGCAGVMSGALVAQAFEAGSWTWPAAAVGGSATFLWWGMTLASQLAPEHL